MSAVYEGGNHATAISSITAAVNSRISTQADGSKALDVESLTAWLQDEFNSMVGDAEATSTTFIATIDCRALAESLNAAIRVENFTSRPDWPALTLPSSIVPAVWDQQAKLGVLGRDITTIYTDAQHKVAAEIVQYMRSVVEPLVTAGVPIVTEERVAIYTYVTDRGEESAPSAGGPDTPVECDQNDILNWAVDPPPAGRNITHINLYRSNSGSNSADYQLVPNPDDDAGWLISALTTVSGKLIIPDSIPNKKLGEVCPTVTWDEPPADFRGVVSMAGGIIVGYSGNTIIPSEPGVPYAYPTDYRRTTSHPIVGLCALDQLLVAGTHGPLKLLYGDNSASFTEIVHSSGQSVVSGRSMVAMSMGLVIAACPDGLIGIDTAGTVRLLTGPTPEGFELFTREDWQNLDPDQIFAAEWEGNYIFHVPAGFCYVFNPRTGKLTTLAATGSAFYSDKLTDTLYMANGTTLVALGSGTGRRTGLWKSKRIVLPAYTGFSWLQVNADFADGDEVTVRLYADGALFKETVVTSRAPVRLPDGRYMEWEKEVEAAIRVEQVTVAETTKQLKVV